jgi:hypothetical protein
MRADYDKGFLDALSTYAYWVDGEQYVGTSGTSLKEARASYKRAHNYDPPKQTGAFPKCPRCSNDLYRRGTYCVQCANCDYEADEKTVVDYYIAHIEARDDEIEELREMVRNPAAIIDTGSM